MLVPKKPPLVGPSFGATKTGEGCAEVVGVAREPSGGDDDADRGFAAFIEDSASCGDVRTSEIWSDGMRKHGCSLGVGGLLLDAEVDGGRG